MARKRFAVKPIEPLVFDFADGTQKKAIYTVETFIQMQDEFGNLEELFEKEKDHPYNLASKILYSGMKMMDSNTTLQEAESIVIGGGIGLIEVLFENVLESFDGLDMTEEELKKKIEKETMKLLQKK